MEFYQRTQRVGSYFPLGCLATLLLLCVLPWLFVDAMQQAMENLHLSPQIALLVIVGILLGGFVNLPVYKFERYTEQVVRLGGIYSLMGWVPIVQRVPTQTIIAVNLGGCVIPSLLAFFEIAWVFANARPALWALAVAVVVNTLVCYFAARPVQGLGITMPTFVSPAVSVLLAWLLLSGEQYGPVRAPVAFVAGVLGPLIGADLLHLRDITRISIGVLSIGGAGTFDGIVLSGILAALLAGL